MFLKTFAMHMLRDLPQGELQTYHLKGKLYKGAHLNKQVSLGKGTHSIKKAYIF